MVNIRRWKFNKTIQLVIILIPLNTNAPNTVCSLCLQHIPKLTYSRNQNYINANVIVTTAVVLHKLWLCNTCIRVLWVKECHCVKFFYRDVHWNENRGVLMELMLVMTFAQWSEDRGWSHVTTTCNYDPIEIGFFLFICFLYGGLCLHQAL